MVWMLTLYLMSDHHWIVIEQRRERASTCEIFRKGIRAADPGIVIVCVEDIL